MSDKRPIGIFDSGVGGLTVLKAIRERLPEESTIYVADLLHFPYGPRYQDEVRGFAIDIIRYLETRDVKLVVIACNTATAAALNHARELFEVPIVGVISPGAQAAVEATKNNRIGVISTEGTMRSQEYLHAIKELDPMVGVYQKACPELVDLVESGQADSKRAEQILHRDLADIVQLGADTLVLGCTHYPLLSGLIQLAMGEPVTLVSSAEETAKDLLRVLTELDLLRPHDAPPATRIFEATGEPAAFTELASRFLGPALDGVRPVRRHVGAAT